MNINDPITCDNESYGNGVITFISLDESYIFIKFDNRDLPTMCSSKTMKTIHADDAKKNVSFKIIESSNDEVI